MKFRTCYASFLNEIIINDNHSFLDTMLSTLEKEHGIPVISVAINGGYSALDILLNCIPLFFPSFYLYYYIDDNWFQQTALTKGLSTVILEGTGRTCDAISRLVKVARKHNIPPEKATLKHLRTIAVRGISIYNIIITPLCNYVVGRWNWGLECLVEGDDCSYQRLREDSRTHKACCWQGIVMYYHAHPSFLTIPFPLRFPFLPFPSLLLLFSPHSIWLLSWL